MKQELNRSLKTMKAVEIPFVALLVSLVVAIQSKAATVDAANCTYSAVVAAYNAAAPGDTVTIPPGDCQSANRWDTYLTITKRNLTIRGSGSDRTTIGIALRAGLSYPTAGFQIQADGVRITAVGFNCNYLNTSNAGIIRVGVYGTDPTASFRDYRIDHNIFNSCGGANGNVTGFDAITLWGFVYGVVDHNTFNDCNGECITTCSDGIPGALRSLAFGEYTNGTHFIEDNTFNVTRAGIYYENAVDGNSAQRVTFRYNTINIADGAKYGGDIVSGHETCARCSGSTAAGDVGTMVYEVYENTINLNSTGIMRGFMHARGGRGLVYNNHVRYAGSSANRWFAGLFLENLRSGEYYGGVGFCGMAANPRGLSDVCHEPELGYRTEGGEASKTTLAAALNSTATTLTLASSAGFSSAGDANGFVVRIGSEVIRYTSLSGSQLLGLTRGVQGTIPASHAAGTPVDYLKLGVCDGQPNNTYIWNNDINGVVSSALNDGYVSPLGNKSIVDFTTLDVKSYAERPNNWQYRTGVPYTYLPYPYPHPLQGAGDMLPPAPPERFRSGN